MKFSWNWLSEFVDLDGIAPETVAERFTLTVAELEAVEKVGQGIDDVIVGRITSVAPHPNADKLRIVEVDVGDRVVRGVSGAPNLAVGIVVPVALPAHPDYLRMAAEVILEFNKKGGCRGRGQGLAGRVR